jgi:F0F1-type ATP synthase assembly protein I
MDPLKIMLIGAILLVIGYITPRILPPLPLGLDITFVLCHITGLLILIIVAIRKSREKKKE